MMSTMHKKVMLPVILLSSAAVGATLAPRVEKRPVQVAQYQPRSVQAPIQAPLVAPRLLAPVAPSAAISATMARWNSLRQSDNLPFSAYSSFLISHRGWPGETALRRTAERQIDPYTTAPSQVTGYFRVHPALTPTGHARHSFALLAEGRVEEARSAARQAWHGGVLAQTDEQRLLSQFGGALSLADHDRRMGQLLDNRDTVSATRIWPLASAAMKPVFSARIALQNRAVDAPTQVANLGSAATADAGLLMDRARYLRDTNQSVASRSLLAQPRQLATRPTDVEKWYETLLATARAAAGDRNHNQAYQIASQINDAYAPGIAIGAQSVGVRDDYTSLAWLAGTTALHELNRPADAARMFVNYARGGKSAQVTTKGLYWAGRAAQASGQGALATSYFNEAASYPELFYGQLALERLGRPVPAPAAANFIQPSPADRAAFQRSDIAQAIRLLGQMGSWTEQSTFVRHLADTADDPIRRALAMELAREVSRPDLSVWVARSARNDGVPFYNRLGYPEARIPAAQSQYWSLANGIIRQESSFDRMAMSPVGARGMMQLMPPTARETAGKMGLGYDLGRLTRDPDYNIQMGSFYFAGLMNSWSGSAPLAVASYNAGAGNVRKWIREYGDPRMPGVDIVRWIENIPFTETRGYVQRVLENAVVYDAMNPARARTPANTRLSSYLGKSNRPG